MAEFISLKIVTPHRKLMQQEVKSFIAPGQNGEFGVMPGHDPWFVALGLGRLTVATKDGDQQFFVNGGFCQIDDDNVVILAETAEKSAEIDLDRAKAAQKRAEDRLKQAAHDDTVDLMRAELALRRSLLRQEIHRV